MILQYLYSSETA